MQFALDFCGKNENDGIAKWIEKNILQYILKKY
jgi:hypothetical protein